MYVNEIWSLKHHSLENFIQAARKVKDQILKFLLFSNSVKILKKIIIEDNI